MIRIPREERQRRLRRWLFTICGIGLFIAVFVVGRAGLISIYQRGRTEHRLRQEVGELKATAVLLRSDIEDYEDTLTLGRRRRRTGTRDPNLRTPNPDQGALPHAPAAEDREHKAKSREESSGSRPLDR